MCQRLDVQLHALHERRILQKDEHEKHAKRCKLALKEMEGHAIRWEKLRADAAQLRERSEANFRVRLLASCHVAPSPPRLSLSLSLFALLYSDVLTESTHTTNAAASRRA